MDDRYTDPLSKIANRKEEEHPPSSFLSRSGKAVSNGLSTVGNLLDLPGSIVRDTLSLKNPFDQLLSPFSEKNRTTGRDLLRQYGMANEKDSWGNFGAGMAAELLLDPLTYTGIGALTKAGTAAKKANLLGKATDVANASAKASAKAAGVSAPKIGSVTSKIKGTPRSLIDNADDPMKAREAFDVAGGAEDMLDQPLKSIVSFRVPGLMKTPVELKSKATNDWLGAMPKDTATKVAEAIDKGASTLKAIPAFRVAQAMFDPSVAGATTELGQEIGKKRSEAIDQSIYGFRDAINPLVRRMSESKLFDKPTLLRSGMKNEKAIELLNRRQADLTNYLEGLVDDLPDDMADLRETFPLVRRMMDDAIEHEWESGLNTQYLGDEFAKYLPRMKRSPAKGFNDPHRTTGPVLDTMHDSMKHRSDAFRDLPGGRSVIDEMSMDPNISGVLHTAPVIRKKLENGDLRELRDYVANTYGDRLSPNYGTDDFDPQEFDSLIHSMAKLDPYFAETKSPMFGRNILHDISQRVEHGLRASGMARATQELFGKAAKPHSAARPDAQLVNLNDALNDLKLFSPRAKANIVEHMGEEAKVARDTLRSDLANNIDIQLQEGQTVSTRDDLGRAVTLRLNDDESRIVKEWTETRRGQEIPRRETVDYSMEELERLTDADSRFLADFGIDKDLHLDATRMIKPFTSPEEVGIVRKVADRFLQLFRTHVTTPFPAFHVRNFISGQAQNVFFKAYDPTAKDPVSKYFRPIKQAYELRNGETLKGIAKDIKDLSELTDEQATKQIQDEIFRYGLIGEKQGIASEFVGDGVESVASQLPGARREVNPLLGKLSPAPEGTTWGDALNPLATKAGIGWDPATKKTRTYYEDHFLPVRAGKDVASFVEDLNRIAPFIAFRKQGFAPEAAAQMVNRIQIDYSRLSQWERKQGRFLAPFYTFSSRMLPLTLEELATNPGGAMASTIKVANRAHDPDAVAPEYVEGSVGIPLGRSDDGTASYLTNFGLGFEDSLAFAPLLSGDMAGTLRELGARSNPLIKFPIEWATQQSLYQDGPNGGRAIRDTQPLIGKTLANISDAATGEESKQARPFVSPLLEHAAANSPFSRYLSTARRLTSAETRENPLLAAANLASGVRVATVSPEAQDSILRARIDARMRELGARTFSRAYFPSDYLGEMNEEELAEIDGIQEELRAIEKRQRQRKKAATVAP